MNDGRASLPLILLIRFPYLRRLFWWRVAPRYFQRSITAAQNIHQTVAPRFPHCRSLPKNTLIYNIINLLRKFIKNNCADYQTLIKKLSTNKV